MAKNTVKSVSKTVVASKTVSSAPDIQKEVKASVDKALEVKQATLDAAKAMFKASQERDTTLSDKILAMVIDNDKAWSTKDDESRVALLLLAEEEHKKIAAVDPGISKLLGKAETDETFHQHVSACLDAKEMDKASAVIIYADFRRMYTLAELNGMAFPGSEVGDVVVKAGYLVDREKKRNKVTGEEVLTVWCNDFADGLPEGKRFTADQDAASKELGTSGSVPALKNVGSKGLKAIIEDCKAKRNALRSMVRRAIKLHHVWTAVSKSNSISLEWVTTNVKDKGIAMPTKCGLKTIDKDNVEYVIMGPKPLWIMPQGKASDGKLLSVTQLTSTKPWLVPGGTMGDLLDTAAQGADGNDGKDKEGTGEKMDNGEALATLQRFYHYANVRDNNADVRLRIANQNKDADGKDWAKMVGLIYHWAKPIYEANRSVIENLNAAEEQPVAKAS